MRLQKTIWALAFALAVCGTAVHAQDQNQGTQQTNPATPIQPINSGLGPGYGGKPVAAARGVSAAYDPQPGDPADVVPDTNTLAGAELFSVGSLGRAHDVFDPSLSVSTLGQTVPQYGAGAPATGGPMSLASTSVVNGSLDFDRTWSQYHLTTFFNGGDTFSSDPIIPHGPFGNVIVTQQIEWARWHLLLRDDFSAAPGAMFTNTGMGGPGLISQMSTMLSASLTGVGEAFIPNETIETGNVLRYRNAALGQAEYSLSRRSALTFSGSYGILHFNDAGYISSRMVNAQAGYDYQLDPSNSIAILGGYGKIDYTGTVSSTWDYMAALAYGRKVTGRLAFQVAAGPQQIHSMEGTGGFQLWLATANAALTYERRRSGYSLSFMRGLNAGAGVFLGAKSDTVTGTAHYQFTRFWTGTVHGGYALNDSLEPAGTSSAQFDNWFVGGNLGRRMGPHAEFNFNYGVQRQNNPAACPVANCGINGYQQSFGLTVNWHLRPAG